MRQIFADQVAPVEGRYLAALRRALPDIGEDGVHFVYAGMFAVLGAYQSGAFATLGWAPRHDGDDTARRRAADRERLVMFVTGGILATRPVQPAKPARPSSRS